MKVQPVLHHGRLNVRYNRPPPTAPHRMMSLWHQSQIGHRSEYSVERLVAFRDYYRRTSVARVVAVCILSPIPAMAVTLLIDCTPLRPPSEGWRANYAFWIRWFLALVVVSAGATAQVRELILPGTISDAGVVVITLVTAAIDVLVAMLVAALWRFPIPFGYILMVGPYLVILLGVTLMVIGRRALAESPVLREQLKSQATIVCAQGLVAMAYPFLTAVFSQLSGPQQTVLVIVMPVFKFITKRVIANAAVGLHEHVGPIVVFSVDVFSVFYVAMCMQISKTMVTTLFIIASDSFHVIVALRDILRQATAIQTRRGEELRGVNYLDDLIAMVRTIFEDDKVVPRINPIRILAPCPLLLSDESSSFLDKISTSGQNTKVLTKTRVIKSGPITIALGRATEVNMAKHLRASPARPRSKSAPVAQHGKGKVLQKEFSPTRFLSRIPSVFPSDVLRSGGSLSSSQGTVQDALQALFHSEYLLMTEYIECALPLLYTGYLAILFHLPVAAYYPQTAASTSQKLSNDVLSILSYSAVELAGFIGLVYFLRRKFGMSPLYQLAFVLETQARTVQGHLFVWTVFILHMPLMHYGKLLRSIGNLNPFI